MSHNRTDRGYALIRRETDGTNTVIIGKSVQNGQLVGVFARHAHVRTLAIGPDVRLSTDGALLLSAALVDVSQTANGPLEIRPAAA